MFSSTGDSEFAKEMVSSQGTTRQPPPQPCRDSHDYQKEQRLVLPVSWAELAPTLAPIPRDVIVCAGGQAKWDSPDQPVPQD